MADRPTSLIYNVRTITRYYRRVTARPGRIYLFVICRRTRLKYVHVYNTSRIHYTLNNNNRRLVHSVVQHVL